VEVTVAALRDRGRNVELPVDLRQRMDERLTAAAGLATARRADVVLAEDLAEAATNADARAKRIDVLIAKLFCDEADRDWDSARAGVSADDVDGHGT
jgi:hypothetical protein